MQIQSRFPQLPRRLHLQREICRAPAPAPPRADSRAWGHTGRLRTRTRLPPAWPQKRRVTIPLSSQTGWTSDTGTCLRAPRGPRALPALNRLHASARAKATAPIGSPHLSRAPPPFSSQKEAVTLLCSDRPCGRRREGPDSASPAVTSARSAPRAPRPSLPAPSARSRGSLRTRQLSAVNGCEVSCPRPTSLQWPISRREGGATAGGASWKSDQSAVPGTRLCLLPQGP